MKLNKILFAFVIAIISISCKNDEKKEDEKKIYDQYKITLNAIVKKDDTFQVYYKESSDDKEPFVEESSVRVDLKGSEKAQDIIFALPENAYPTYLRLDFGSNKVQPEISVNNFKVSYRDKLFTINGNQFFDYFIAEKAFVKFDKATAKAIPFVTEDGNYDPMFFSEATLNAEMVKLSK